MATAHTASLSAKHAQLEALIAQEAQRPHPDDYLLSQLKKEKLRIKEEMAGLRH